MTKLRTVLQLRKWPFMLHLNTVIVISEYYIGILLISELVGSHLIAPNISGALIKYLQEMNISLIYARFFCIDATNVHSGELSGLKQLLKHAAPLGNWVDFMNHKVALCFKHLFNDFPDVLSADATLLALWKFFHYHPLAINFLKNGAAVNDECHVTPVSPGVTRRTAHDRECKCNLLTYLLTFTTKYYHVKLT